MQQPQRLGQLDQQRAAVAGIVEEGPGAVLHQLHDGHALLRAGVAQARGQEGVGGDPHAGIAAARVAECVGLRLDP